MAKRPEVEPIHEPGLFELEKRPELASQLNTDRPLSLPGILLGPSSFTSAGWEGAFYPRGMRSRDYKTMDTNSVSDFYT